jgi:hypothetical protein
MKETFEKVNDYTLRVDQLLESKTDTVGYAASSQNTRLTRIFNFEAAQITTIVKASSLVANRYGHDGGAGASDSVQMNITDFEDLTSVRELSRMHKKLIELGGAPPVLDDVVGNLGKKRPGLKAGG